MIRVRLYYLLIAVALAGCSASGDGLTKTVDAATAPTGEKLVIAHRGASGYLPEHTLAAKAMAYAQGADYIEQDLVMTRDGELVVLHDQYLDTVTNVADLFPERNRDDGRYYVIDFTLAEIRTLSVSERFTLKDGVVVPVFEDRFPLGKSSFRVNTFAEEIELIQGLNKSTGRAVGIYPEIKNPAFHHDEGKDIAAATLLVLKQFGYDKKADRVFLQSFDSEELKRIDSELLPGMDMDLRLVQLIGRGESFHWMLSEKGMSKVADYADGVGPSILLLIATDSSATDIRSTGLVESAHAAGLVVHAYTFRRETSQMPPFAEDFTDFLRMFFEDIGVDGVFTDFPDLAANYLEAGS